MGGIGSLDFNLSSYNEFCGFAKTMHPFDNDSGGRRQLGTPNYEGAFPKIQIVCRKTNVLICPKEGDACMHAPTQ